MQNTKKYIRAEKALLLFIAILYVFAICCVDIVHLCTERFYPQSAIDGINGSFRHQINQKNPVEIRKSENALSGFGIVDESNCPACLFKNLHNITAVLLENADFGSFSIDAYLAEFFNNPNHPIAQQCHIRAPPLG